jgi:hypothetical protein
MGRVLSESFDNTRDGDNMDNIERHMKNIELWKP